MRMSTLLFLFSVIILHSFSQDKNKIKTNVPCTDSMTQNAKGRWIKSADNGSYNSKETSNRLDEIHDMK